MDADVSDELALSAFVDGEGESVGGAKAFTIGPESARLLARFLTMRLAAGA